MAESAGTSYEDAVLFILAYEFSNADVPHSKAKIERKLKAAKLGEYDDQRIELLRRLKTEVKAEIDKGPQSGYYTHSHGKPADIGQFADHRDFDRDRMVAAFAESFPSVPRQSILQFVDYAIFLYYLK